MNIVPTNPRIGQGTASGSPDPIGHGSSIQDQSPLPPSSNNSRLPMPIAILGVPFDNVTTTEAIHLVEQMIASRRPHYLATANVDFLVQAQRDTELRRILCDAHLVLCDGTPLLWASHLLGNPLPERVAGADLVPLLIQVAAERDYRLFFLGASPESASQAVANLRRQLPRLKIAGNYSPPYQPLLEMDHDEIKRRIQEARPDLLFVSFGCPKQEKWMAMHYRSLGVPVIVGVGATIDFLAGRVRRAPVWMQRSGTEWVFRLAQEPRRLFRRYFTDLWVFGWKIIAQWWRMHSRSAGSRSKNQKLTLQVEKEYQAIKLPEILDLEMVQSQEGMADQILIDGHHCLMDMNTVKFIDSSGLGLLIRLQKKLREAGRQLILVAPSPAARRTFALMHLEEFFSFAPDMLSAKQRIALPAQNLPLNPTIPGDAKRDLLRWQGEITAANAEDIWRKTVKWLARNPLPPQLVIDLSEVMFIDSSGLGVMLRARKMAQRQGAKLIFTGLRPAVRNVLHIARLEDFLLAAST